MFTRYKSEFAEVNSALAIKGAMVNLGLDTMVETRQGWTAVAALNSGDEVATLDGGFAPISWIGRAQPAIGGLLVPAGSLDNCSDVVLPEEARIGVEAPLHFDAESDHVSLPLAAFEGLRGIRRPQGTLLARTLGFETEEMVWAQTGLLVHASPITDPFFQMLSFGDARGLIALLDAGHFELAQAA